MSEDVEMKPIMPEEAGAIPPKVGLSPVDASPAPAASTVKLKPIIRRPMIRKPVIGGAKPVVLKPASGTPPAPAAVPEAAAAAQNPSPAPAKPVQEAMPAQAILHKTGIIAEGILTPAQAQAAKTKTSRISLESAIGVAPTMKSAMPMKTIKLRRLTDLPPASGAVKPAAAASAPASEPSAAPEPAAIPPAPAAAVTDSTESQETETAKPLEKPATVTQKKTLKLHRPPNFKRPTVGGLKRPGAVPSAAEGKSPADAVVADLSNDVAELAPVADIPDLKPTPQDTDVGEDSSGTVAGVPSWLNISTIAAGVAALIVMGLCTWTLFREAVGPAAGPNDLATFHSETDYRR